MLTAVACCNYLVDILVWAQIAICKFDAICCSQSLVINVAHQQGKQSTQVLHLAASCITAQSITAIHNAIATYHNMAQHCTAQHDTASAQHSTAQHSTAQHSTAQQAKRRGCHCLPFLCTNPSLHGNGGQSRFARRVTACRQTSRASVESTKSTGSLFDNKSSMKSTALLAASLLKLRLANTVVTMPAVSST